MLSVIIPVYNREKFLPRCIKSILAQTYEDFELLLVDDGSTDDSLHICQQFADKDCRIRVLHQENGGVSSARNLALQHVKGEWVAFIDSDDYVKPDYLQHLVEKVDEDRAMVMNIYPYEVQFQSLDLCVSGKDIIDAFIKYDLFRYSGPVCKLFNVSVMKEESIRFPQGIHCGEDAIMILRYLMYVDKLVVFCKDDYCEATEGREHLANRYYNPEEEWRAYTTYKKYFLKLLGKNYHLAIPGIQEWAKRRLGLSCLYYLKSLHRTKNMPSLKDWTSYLCNIPHEDKDNMRMAHPTEMVSKLLRYLYLYFPLWMYKLLAIVDRYLYIGVQKYKRMQ